MKTEDIAGSQSRIASSSSSVLYYRADGPILFTKTPRGVLMLSICELPQGRLAPQAVAEAVKSGLIRLDKDPAQHTTCPGVCCLHPGGFSAEPIATATRVALV